LCTDESGGELAKVGLVANQRNPPALDAFGERGEHNRGFMAGRQFVERANGRMVTQTCRQQIGSLPGANERARIDLIDPDAKPDQTFHHFSKAAHTIGREWSLGVVGPVIATLGRYAVADEIELARSHLFGNRLNHTTAV